MSKQLEFIDRQWRWMQRFFIVWPFWCALIIGINVWDDASNNRPFNWQNFLAGMGIALFGGVVYLASLGVMKFVRLYLVWRDNHQ